MDDSDFSHGGSFLHHIRQDRLTPRRPIHLVLAIVIGALGMLNVLAGFGVIGHVPVHGPLVPLDESLTEGFAAFGRSGQIGLGLALVVSGGGLLFRLRSAWAFSILLLVAMLVTNFIKGQRAEMLLLGGPILVVLAVLVRNRRAFDRQDIAANLLIALVSLSAVVGYAVLGSYLLGQGFSPKIEDLPTALYYAVITLATVGFGDITPATVETRLFTVTVLAFGLGTFATTVANVLGTTVAGNLRRVLAPEGGAHMNLKNHVILVGGGTIAENTALELEARKQPFVRILAGGTEAARVIIGDASEDAVLERAGVRQARLVIAASDNDADNAMISLTAKDLNPEVQVLALAETPERIARLKRARADLVFAPAAVGGRLLASLAEGQPISQEFVDLLRGEL